MPPRRGRVRIVEEETSRFSDGLEARARQLLTPRESSAWDGDPLRTLDRQIALAVEEIDRARAVQATLLKSALVNECVLHTELIQMEARTPRYSPYRYPEREKIQRRLLGLDHERRQLLASYEQRMAELRHRLLELLERHGQLE